MRTSSALLLAALIGFGFAPPRRAHKPVPRPTHVAPRPLPCGDYLSFQVLLDRQGFSPGQIDGRPGDNFTKALIAMQVARQVPLTQQPDCDTWHALGGDPSGSALVTYTVTAKDLKGPFEKQIPQSLIAQAKLPALGYRSPLEELAERFHASPALLERINHRTPLIEGQSIEVPAVTPFDPSVKPAPSQDSDLTVQVSRAESALRVTRGDGSLVFFAPVTTGSEHDPLPIGNWSVVGIDWHPVFHYNPQLFWDAKATDTKATLKPGPNSPVGIVWITLNLEHYGLHGTPEPARIGHTESHGCVRLTNWDAVRVASLVKRGTPVVFK